MTPQTTGCPADLGAFVWNRSQGACGVVARVVIEGRGPLGPAADALTDAAEWSPMSEKTPHRNGAVADGGAHGCPTAPALRTEVA